MLFGLVGAVVFFTVFAVVYICFSSEKPITTNSANTIKPIGFWKRQFQKEATSKQRFFDWAFGVILPVICFTFDPLIFKSNGAFLGAIKPFAYLLSFISIMGMMAWLIWGEKLKWLNAVFSGLFVIGGLISLVIGVFLFPLSLIGLVVLIGILGFTPLFTSVIYLRNAVRAYHFAKPFFEKRVLIWAVILSGMFSFVIPFTINFEINKLITEMRNGDMKTIQRNTKILKFVSPITNFSSLGFYSDSYDSNPEREKAIEEAYQELHNPNDDFNGYWID